MVELSENAFSVAKSRYLMEGEDWDGLAKRVATYVGRGEDPEIVEEFEEVIRERLFIPGGRILRNAGRKAGSMTNCVVLPVGDSIEEIGQLYRELLILWSEGSGVGVNWTPLRPKGAPILRKGGYSSGLVSFLKVASQIGETVESGGCFAGGTQIMTDRGLVPVEEVNIGDKAYTHKGFRNVSYTFDNGVKDVYSIRTEKGYSVEVTLNHKFAIRNKDGSFHQVPLSRLNVGDVVTVLPRDTRSVFQIDDDRIVSIDYVGRKNVYDLEVEDVHLLSGNGFYTSNSRRAAGLALVHIDHPEVEDFIDSKLRDGEIPNFNISVGVTKEFLLAVKTGKKFELKWGNIKREVYARDLWEKILSNMLNKAEPGLINIDNFRKTNTYYFSPIECCNACSEQPLPKYGSCNLGSIVLPKFFVNKNTNWQKLAHVIRLAVRFLDCVIDVCRYSLPQLQEEAFSSRRVGLGFTGIADYLLLKQIRYGSDRSVEEIEKLYKFLRNEAYLASIELSKEKGPFGKFDKFHYLNSSFVKKLPVRIRMAIEDNGIRNSCLTTQAPTGTTSLVAECSSGIEPIISKAHVRNDRVGRRIYIHPKYEEILTNRSEEEDMPYWFVDSYDISPEEHLEVQVAASFSIDSSVSKTINLPRNTKEEDLDRYLLEYIQDLKGITVYRDGSREGQILTPLSEKEALEAIKSKSGDSDLLESEVQCSSGTCDI